MDEKKKGLHRNEHSYSCSFPSSIRVTACPPHPHSTQPPPSYDAKQLLRTRRRRPCLREVKAFARRSFRKKKLLQESNVPRRFREKFRFCEKVIIRILLAVQYVAWIDRLIKPINSGHRIVFSKVILVRHYFLSVCVRVRVQTNLLSIEARTPHRQKQTHAHRTDKSPATPVKQIN